MLDRAGITGDDGASHNGMWDLAIMRVVPGLRLAAPRDGQQLVNAIEKSVCIADGPSVIRFPKGTVSSDVPAIRSADFGDVLVDCDAPDVTFVSIGGLVHEVLEAASQLTAQGLRVRVIDPVWALPITDMLVQEIRNSPIVVTVEDGVIDGGIGEAIGAKLHQCESTASVVNLGVPKAFLPHAKRAKLLKDLNLDARGIAAAAQERVRSIVH